MICQNYIARCYRVYQHERNENASFLSIFNCRGRPKWRFSNFPRFWKNSSALGSFNFIFENNSLKALFGQNIKKLKILKLSPDFRYLQKLALKSLNWFVVLKIVYAVIQLPGLSKTYIKPLFPKEVSKSWGVFVPKLRFKCILPTSNDIWGLD